MTFMNGKKGSMTPQTVELPADLVEIQNRWQKSLRAEQDEMYAQEFGPKFASLFAQLPLHGMPSEMERPNALISLLGLSWQPVALMASWAQPERMLVLGTKESLGVTVRDEPVLKLISRVSGVSLDRIEHREIPSEGEVEIYREIRAFITRHGLKSKSVFIDPTGGKKTMSCAGALAGFLLGAVLVYVDYTQYVSENRIPLAGTEYPRLVANPLDALGDVEIDQIRVSFNAGNYSEAEHRSRELAMRLYEPREAEGLEFLARGYGLWSAFRFKEALADLERIPPFLERHHPRGQWAWTREAIERLDQNLPVLRLLSSMPDKPVAMEEGMPLVLNHLAAAEAAVRSGRVSHAVMLLYATIERYVDLCLWVLFGLDDEKPDYDKIKDTLNMQRYHDTGRRMFGARNYQERQLGGPLQFAGGIQLLAALAPDRMNVNFLGHVHQLGQARNKCEFEHGFLPQPPDAGKTKGFMQLAKQILTVQAGSAESLEAELDRYRFPKL